MPAPPSVAGQSTTRERRLLAAATPVTLSRLAGAVATTIQGTATLESAAQATTSLLYGQYEDSLALVRIFLAMPYRRLPPREQAFASDLTASHGHGAELIPDTLVLTLLGSSGASPAWNDRRQSSGHVAIPLLGEKFVASVPMLAALLTELGFELSWFSASKDVFSRKLLGGFNGLFYVPDARTASDAQGRAVIPAREFVEGQRVRTVFGVGGTYVDDSILAMILFTRETLTRPQVEQFSFLASAFKTATARLLIGGHLFGP